MVPFCNMKYFDSIVILLAWPQPSVIPVRSSFLQTRDSSLVINIFNGMEIRWWQLNLRSSVFIIFPTEKNDLQDKTSSDHCYRGLLSMLHWFEQRILECSATRKTVPSISFRGIRRHSRLLNQKWEKIKIYDLSFLETVKIAYAYFRGIHNKIKYVLLSISWTF